MLVEILDPLGVEEWDQWVLSFPQYCFFHRSAWLKVLKDTYGYEPLAFAAKVEAVHQVLVPIMEVRSLLTGRRGVSLPFSDFCPPLLRGTFDEFSEARQTMVDYGRSAGWKRLEIRASPQTSDARVCGKFVHHLLKLTPKPESLLAGCSDATRRNVRRAVRDGLRVRCSHSLRAVEAFYRMHVANRKHHGLPPQPFLFFRNLHRHVIEPGDGRIVEALLGDRVVAASVFVSFGKRALYKYGASDPNFLQSRPNNLVIWEAIKWYATNGFEELSFGRSDPSGAGLIRFKEGWGARAESLEYGSYELNPRLGDPEPKGREGSRVLKALPLPVLRLIGTALYRHFG